MSDNSCTKMTEMVGAHVTLAVFHFEVQSLSLSDYCGTLMFRELRISKIVARRSDGKKQFSE